MSHPRPGCCARYGGQACTFTRLGGPDPLGNWDQTVVEGALWRGFSLAEMLLPCAILLAVGIVSFAVGARAFRWMHED